VGCLPKTVAMTHYDSEALQHYRAKAAETAKLRDDVEKLTQDSRVTGDLDPALNVLQQLTLKTKELEDLRQTLGPEGLFLAKYGYEKINDHIASFVLPKGCSRIEILHEALGLVQDVSLIDSWCLEKWGQAPEFTHSAASSERICIDGHVEGGTGQTRAQQIYLLRGRGLALPALGDVVVAFALHWVATGEPLFGRDRQSGRIYCIRTADTWIDWVDTGLAGGFGDTGDSYPNVGVSARIYS
jgi:hypothetical protein